MGAKMNMAPPPTLERDGFDGGWTELVSGLNRAETEQLEAELLHAGIPTRSFEVFRNYTVLVRLSRIDDARFILAVVSFRRSPAHHGPRAERGSLHWTRSFALAIAIVIGLAGTTAAFLHQPQVPADGKGTCSTENTRGYGVRGAECPPELRDEGSAGSTE